MSTAAGELKRIRVAVVGAGEFGRNHARVYRELEGVELVGVFDENPERAAAVAAEYQTLVFTRLEELHGRADAASVDPERIFLTTSTSEAYTYLFRLLCEPGDAHGLADVLAELRSNTALRERLVRNGYQTAIARFGTAAYVSGVERILKGVVGGKKAR